MDTSSDEENLQRFAHESEEEAQEAAFPMSKRCGSSKYKRQLHNEVLVTYWQQKKKTRSAPDLRELGNHAAPSGMLESPGPEQRVSLNPYVHTGLTEIPPGVRALRFPEKMHAILSCEELSDIVSWLPNGKNWRISKPREFEIRVLPKYFDHGKFSSFIREAYCWGFQRVTEGTQRNSFYHEFFVRGQGSLCRAMEASGNSEFHERCEKRTDEYIKQDKQQRENIAFNSTVSTKMQVSNCVPANSRWNCPATDARSMSDGSRACNAHTDDMCVEEVIES